KIALIVPDESIVPLLRSFDRAQNFNFAMGQSFREDISYKFLDQLHNYLSGDGVAKEFLQHNSFDFSLAIPAEAIGVEEFFALLKTLNIPRFNSETLLEELEKVNLLESYYRFVHIFKTRELHFKEWLFIWLHELGEHSIDDTRGGKVTVMGLLESRGILFDGVVVLDFNDDKAPSVSNKDRFLNSSVRAAAKLPTKTDRENLQKHYYARLLEKAKSSVLIYSSSDNAQPSKFLYELGVAGSIKRYKTPHELLFNTKSNYNAYKHMDDIEFDFDAHATVWSASKLKTFLECRRKFYYRYIKGLQEVRESELNDGAILHTLLYRVINPQSSYSESSELKKALLQEMAKIESADNRLPYKRLLWDAMLDGFVQKQIEHFRSGWQVANCEFEASGTIAGLEFKGRIDRMDSKDTQSLIIDYKSGSIQSANGSKIENLADFQMSIYAKLLDRPVDNIDIAFVEILNGGKLTYLQSPQEKEEKLLEHIEYLKSQKSLRAERCEDLQKCRYCPYTLLCHRGEYL
ncbi:MAG TPA: PD-(D/E)XK nuclease family protein, partial [Nitratifractor sp.]|nr:PD-(D/E)XK nuclease family protein [Nitratifractor sp.]